MGKEIVEAKYDASRPDSFANLVAISLFIWYVVGCCHAKPVRDRRACHTHG